MEGLVVRPAPKEDLREILALYSQPAMDNGDALNAAAAEAIFLRIQRMPNYSLYVAYAGPTLVGTFALLVMENLVHQGRPSGVIEAVVVSPAYQGRGIGRRMMEEAMRLCRAAGCYKVALSTNLSRTEAHQFYESLGFRKHGYSFVVEF